MEIPKMKTRWIEVMIIVMALGLLSLCFAAWDNTKPADSDAFYTWPASIRANNDALEVVMGVNLVGVHPYYQSATPLKKPDASTNLDADDLGRIWIDSDDERMYVFAAVTPTWTSYPSLTLPNTFTDVQTLADGSLLATSAAPTADAEIANKKYVDDHVGHDGDGYVLYDVDGTPTKVYTKYLTGTLDADATTLIAHGLTAGNILAVNVICYEDDNNYYAVNESRSAAAASLSFIATYDDTYIRIESIGTSVQGNAYRIKIDYTT